MNKEEQKQPISGFIKDLLITEKATYLSQGNFSKKNKDTYPYSKVVFKVATNATKTSIMNELNQRFPDNRVVTVNTMLVKPKKKRYFARGKAGYTKMFKKAIVTFVGKAKIEINNTK